MTAPAQAPAKPYCSFCVKSADEVAKLIAGAGVCICDECVRKCNVILEEESKGNEPRDPSTNREITGWAEMADDQILTMLPKIAMVAAQADSRVQFLVDLLRGRGVAWARIGGALGVTRQSAWERFSGEE